MDLKSIQSDIVTSTKASGFNESVAEVFVSSYEIVKIKSCIRMKNPLMFPLFVNKIVRVKMQNL